MRNCSVAVDVPVTDAPNVPVAVSRVKVIAAYVMCALIWGTTWHAIRICIAPGGYPVFLAAAIRFSAAALLLVPFCLLIRNKLSYSSLGWLIFAGLLSGCGYGLIYKAEENLAGGLAAVISAASPSLALTLAAVLNIEKNTWQSYFGSILALAGVALTYHATMSFSPSQASAVLMMLAVCVLHAMSNVVIKKFGSHTHPLFLNTVYFAGAAISVWVFAFTTSAYVLPSPIPYMPTVALAYLTLFGTLIAFGSFFYLIKHASLNVAMTMPLVTPIVALMVDTIVGDNKIVGVETYLGIAIVLSSVIANLCLSYRGTLSK